MTVSTAENHAPGVLTRPEHIVSRRNISTAALKVLYRLHRSGYLAYMVGGGVRDLLLGRRPKDFDVATNASPREVRRLFRNSRIIGRRFRLVHVMFRDEIVEVATFRASPEPPEVPDDWEDENETEEEVEGVDIGRGARIEEDIVYGTPPEDARRRDFTVNGLFYNIADFSIIDYVGGLDDLRKGVIRTIGQAEQRFEEDPVRMMRALEYAVRLEFAIDHETKSAIEHCKESIGEAAPARLTYELMESLHSGRAAGICDAWLRSGIIDRAFPELGPRVGEAAPVLAEVDRMVKARTRLHDAALLGALFLPAVTEILRGLTGDGQRVDNVALLTALRDLLDPSAARMHISNHTQHLMHQGLFTLSKLRRAPERGRQVLKLTRQDYFPVAWDLCSLAQGLGLVPAEAWKAWSRAVARVRSGAGEAEVQSALERAPSSKRRRPRRRRRRR